MFGGVHKGGTGRKQEESKVKKKEFNVSCESNVTHALCWPSGRSISQLIGAEGPRRKRRFVDHVPETKSPWIISGLAGGLQAREDHLERVRRAGGTRECEK